MLKEDKDSGFAKFLIGLIFGLAAGYVAAMLITEKTGPELRKDFVENSNEILENMNFALVKSQIDFLSNDAKL